MKFGYTILYVKDVPSTVAFYARAFGFKQTFIHDSGHYAELDTGDKVLGFGSHQFARDTSVSFVADPSPGQPSAMQVCFVTEDVAAAFQQAVAAGAEPLAEPKQKPSGQTAGYVRDNNGFLVELCTPVGRPAAPFAIRPITPADTPALVALSISSGLFKPEESDVVRGVFDGYHAARAEDGPQAFSFDEGGALIGIVYFTPMEMTDRAWELLMIAVDADRYGQGIGTRMLLVVEDTVRAANGRMLLIETSSTPEFERTRQFYRRHGYAEVAHIPDVFADGDGKVVFTKRIATVHADQMA